MAPLSLRRNTNRSPIQASPPSPDISQSDLVEPYYIFLLISRSSGIIIIRFGAKNCQNLIMSDFDIFSISFKTSQKLRQSMSWSAFQERKQGKLSRSLASPYLGCSLFWSGLTPWNLFAHNFGPICTTLAFGCNKAMVILLQHSKSISNQFGFATKWMQWKSAVGRDLGNINL